MNFRIVRAVVVGMVAALSAHVATAQTPLLAGDWSGQSFCGAGNPSCHAEYVVYHISVDPADATTVKIAADKIVDGKHTRTEKRNIRRDSSAVTNHANGTFEVKLTLQDDKSDDQDVGRMTIDKQ